VRLARQELDHRAHQDHTVLCAANRAPRFHAQVVERPVQAVLLSKKNKETQRISRLCTLWGWCILIEVLVSVSVSKKKVWGGSGGAHKTNMQYML
jgi:hypothetical protein